jgi:hypothetical protein
MMTTKLERFIISKCYCGYLSNSREIHKELDCIPQLCIWCNVLNEYYKMLDDLRKVNKESKDYERAWERAENDNKPKVERKGDD